MSYTQLLAAPLYTQLFPSTSIYDHEPPSPHVSSENPNCDKEHPMPEDCPIPKQSLRHYAKAGALDKNVGPFNKDEEEIMLNHDDNNEDNNNV